MSKLEKLLQHLASHTDMNCGFERTDFLEDFFKEELINL